MVFFFIFEMILASERSGLRVREGGGSVGGGLGGGGPGQNGAVGRVGGGLQGWGPDRWGPRRVGVPKGWRTQKKWGPKGGGPKISRFLFPLPPPFSLFLSLWVSSRGILVVFEAPGPSNSTFGPSGCLRNGSCSLEECWRCPVETTKDGPGLKL